MDGRGAREMWLPQLRGLSDTYQVIAPDLPGHGVLAGIPFTFSNAAQILAEIIRQQANGRALAAGLSLGGYVAMEFARQLQQTWKSSTSILALKCLISSPSARTETCMSHSPYRTRFPFWLRMGQN